MRHLAEEEGEEEEKDEEVEEGEDEKDKKEDWKMIVDRRIVIGDLLSHYRIYCRIQRE